MIINFIGKTITNYIWCQLMLSIDIMLIDGTLNIILKHDHKNEGDLDKSIQVNIIQP